jgi:hypothetical protein
VEWEEPIQRSNEAMAPANYKELIDEAPPPLHVPLSLFFSMEWFEVAILEGFYPSSVQPQTNLHWHLYRKSLSHEGGKKEA